MGGSNNGRGDGFSMGSNVSVGGGDVGGGEFHFGTDQSHMSGRRIVRGKRH